MQYPAALLLLQLAPAACQLVFPTKGNSHGLNLDGFDFSPPVPASTSAVDAATAARRSGGLLGGERAWEDQQYELEEKRWRDQLDEEQKTDEQKAQDKMDPDDLRRMQRIDAIHSNTEEWLKSYHDKSHETDSAVGYKQAQRYIRNQQQQKELQRWNQGEPLGWEDQSDRLQRDTVAEWHGFQESKDPHGDFAPIITHPAVEGESKEKEIGKWFRWKSRELHHQQQPAWESESNVQAITGFTPRDRRYGPLDNNPADHIAFPRKRGGGDDQISW